MKFILITCLLLGYLALTCAQDLADRRTRLRNLISSARGGDLEARKALQGLRKQIELRRAQGITRAKPKQSTAPVVVDRITTQLPVIDSLPTTDRVPVEITTFHRQMPERRIFDATPVETSRPFREPRQQELSHRFAPHRTLHRALEVDDRSEMFADVRVTDRTKTPPVQTTRRYSYYDEVGNYIFGYQATDGSFREEIRGRDCIVRGKYGYVDPNGVKREFSYTSGNRCDPNAASGKKKKILAPNDQFLIQTQEKQLDEAALNKIVFNRRRQPTSRTRLRNQENRRPQKVFQLQEQEISTSLPTTRQTDAPIQSRIAAPTQSHIAAPTQSRIAAPIQSRIAAPTQRTTAAEKVRLTTKVTKAPIREVFRPTPKPTKFNFDEEFKNIFQSFDNNLNNAPQSRPIPSLFTQPSLPVRQPKIHNHFSQPALPVGKPKISSHFSQPALPGVSFKPEQTRAQKESSPAPKKTATNSIIAHQLVFDAKTGSFTTIPISVPQNRVKNPNLLSTPKKNIPSSGPTGRPLQTGFNPLPVVPIGGLSFSNSNTARDFNHFFNQFKI